MTLSLASRPSKALCDSLADAPTGGQQSGGDEAEASLAAAPPVVPPGHKTLAELGARLLFEKVMTTCDISGHGRIVIPKVRLVAASLDQPRSQLPHKAKLDGGLRLPLRVPMLARQSAVHTASARA